MRRAVSGSTGRPLTSQTNDLGRERAEGVAVEDGPRHERRLGAIDLDQVRTPRGDPDDKPNDAGSGDNARRPLVFESSTDLVEPHNSAKPVEHRIEGRRQVAEDREVESLESLRQVCADLRLTLASGRQRSGPAAQARR